MHSLKLGSITHTFNLITSVNHFDQINKYDYVILVNNGKTVDMWTTMDKGRGCNELVRYYELQAMEINEQDLIILSPVT